MMKYLTKWGGGGYNSYPQLGQTSTSKQAKNSSNADEVLYSAPHYANYGTKTKYKISRTTQMLMWLLMICIFAAFSLCPLARLAAHYNLTAGGPNANTFYTNAPVFVAGDTNRDEKTGSASTTTGELNNSAKNHALFKTDGAVDTTVLADLLNMLDDSKVKANSMGTGDVKYYSAKNFGKFGVQDAWTSNQKGNAQILVKLFEDTTTTTNSVNAAASQYWQAVYRSINGKNDVLTLYMVRPYATIQGFNPGRDATYNNKTYRYEGNYSQSYLRDKTVMPLYETLKSTYSALDQYVVAPYQLSSSNGKEFDSSASGLDASGKNTKYKNKTNFLNLGGWQSSAYQTSYNSSRVLYSVNEGIGSSGYKNNGTYFGLENGMDGLSGKHNSWEGTIDSVYGDKLWVPSCFEAIHTGYGKNDTGIMQNTGESFDEDNKIGELSNVTATGIAKSNNRTGLWELSPYDRTSDSSSWTYLRSGYSESASEVFSFAYTGISGTNVQSYCGLRVALHLSLGALKSLLTTQPQETKLNISATNNAANSLLVLTVMDGNTHIAEYSCISGTINSTLTLDWNKTYKIIATRPFGSDLEVKLDDVLQLPTIFACYEIQTAENEQMNIIFTLSGDGSWKNCVVV